MPPFAFFPSTGLSQFGKWQTWAGAESSSSSCSKVQLGHSFRQGAQFKLKTSIWIKNVCTLQGRSPHHRHHPPWRLVRKQFSSQSNLMIYLPWCDKVWQGVTRAGERVWWFSAFVESCSPSVRTSSTSWSRSWSDWKEKEKVFVHHHLSRWLYQKKISVHSFVQLHLNLVHPGGGMAVAG